MPRSNDTQISMRTANIPILVSKYYYSLKGAELLRKTAGSRFGAGKIQDEPGTSHSAIT